MTGLLLDTHAVLWWWAEPDRLTQAAVEAVSTEDVWISAVSALEIAIKYRLGKLPAIGDPSQSYRRLMASNGFRSLPVDDRHALYGGSLPGTHRDPFDRLIAAQALIEDLTVVTRDSELAAFGCRTLW